VSLTYTTYVNSISNIVAIPATDPGFSTMVPNMIDDAEQRLYRELDLLNTVVADVTGVTTPGNRSFSLPSTQGTFIVVDQINIISGGALPAGTINVCTPASLEAVQTLWPSQSGSSIPQYFAMFKQGIAIFGPVPDQAYTVEVIGTVRPEPLSTTNVTTLLSVYFPDLFIAASMVFVSGYMKNFGSMADDPKMAQSWQSHYDALMSSAQTEEQRKKFNMAGWSSKQPAPAATPPRS
jgi:hypothetical protein